MLYNIINGLNDFSKKYISFAHKISYNKELKNHKKLNYAENFGTIVCFWEIKTVHRNKCSWISIEIWFRNAFVYVYYLYKRIKYKNINVFVRIKENNLRLIHS